jgi:hypothetical protein
MKPIVWLGSESALVSAPVMNCPSGETPSAATSCVHIGGANDDRSIDIRAKAERAKRADLRGIERSEIHQALRATEGARVERGTRARVEGARHRAAVAAEPAACAEIIGPAER